MEDIIALPSPKSRLLKARCQRTMQQQLASPTNVPKLRLEDQRLTFQAAVGLAAKLEANERHELLRKQACVAACCSAPFIFVIRTWSSIQREFAFWPRRRWSWRRRDATTTGNAWSTLRQTRPLGSRCSRFWRLRAASCASWGGPLTACLERCPTRERRARFFWGGLLEHFRLRHCRNIRLLCPTPHPSPALQAFIFILVTDILLGFHSEAGWEVSEKERRGEGMRPDCLRLQRKPFIPLSHILM